jgi:SagB-type dehydrogenase family enzyme
VANANLLIIIANTADRTLKKYGPRGYRYLLLEAGHIGQALCMLATEAGLATLCVGGFRDRRVNRWLQLPGSCVGALYLITVGWSGESSG